MSEMPRIGNKLKYKSTNKKTKSINSDIITNRVYSEIYMELVLDIVPILQTWTYFFQMLGKNQIQNGETGVSITNLSAYVDLCLF